MELQRTIKYLFDRNCDDEMSEDEEDALQKVADDLVAEHGWNAVFSAANEYLRQHCITPESAINFAILYWDYRWYENPISNPYGFLAYFYFRINWQANKYDDRDILDSLAVTMLPKAGYQNADLALNPRYMPENDPALQREVEKLQKDPNVLHEGIGE